MSEPLLQGGLALCLFLTELMVDGLAFAFDSHALGRDRWVIGAYVLAAMWFKGRGVWRQ